MVWFHCLLLFPSFYYMKKKCWHIVLFICLLLSSFKFSMNWFLCSTIGAVERILNAKVVNHAYPMAPAYGLYLGSVKYDLPWYSGRGLEFIWILAMTSQEESSHFIACITALNVWFFLLTSQSLCDRHMTEETRTIHPSYEEGSSHKFPTVAGFIFASGYDLVWCTNCLLKRLEY